MMKQGTWIVFSESDKRWNGSGRAIVGGFVAPPEADEHIERMKKELGEDPPNDLEVSYFKD